MTSYCRAPVTYTAHQRAIVGDTKMSVIGNDHLGWMKCDGRTLNVNDYYLLWRVVGYAFGSNGTSNTFKLPNAEGRVPGVLGTGTDVNSSTYTISLGDSNGEYVHTLSIAEMPTHNHGISGEQPTNNTTSEDSHNHGGLTDLSGTGITINGVGDHQHTYVHPSTDDNTYTAEPGNTPTGGGYGDSTGAAGAHTHTINDPTHRHGIQTYTHNHTINAAGGSNYHNNVQPFIGIGNMFIFSGKYMAPSNPESPFAGYPYLSNSQIL